MVRKVSFPGCDRLQVLWWKQLTIAIRSGVLTIAIDSVVVARPESLGFVYADC